MKIFQFEHLKALPELVHGVATADYGNMSFLHGEPAEVKKNRGKFFEDLGIDPKKVAVASLLHGDQIITVTDKEKGAGIDDPSKSLEGDIMVANRADTYLFMVVADCLALFYYDQVKKVVALAHAGWRGVDAQVPFKTAFHLMKEYGCKADNILVGMSPAVQKESACYPDLGQESKPEWSKYITKIDDKVCADTNSYAYDQLLSIGIPKENIDRSTIDTRTNTDFFSHLRSKDTGEPEKRFGCVIGFRS